MKNINKMITSAIAIAFLSTSVVADSSNFAGPYIGVQTTVMGVELDANHNDNEGIVTTGTAGKFAIIAGAELGYALPLGDSMLIDLGVTYVSGDAIIESSSTSPTASTSNNPAVKFQMEDYYTFYIAPTFALTDSSSVYFKFGVTESEVTVTGDVTQPGDLQGETYAIGTRTQLASGLFIRTEAGMSEFDTLTVKGKTANAETDQTGVSTLTTITANPTVAYGAVSIGYKF